MTEPSAAAAATTTTIPKKQKHPALPLGDINIVVLTDVHSWLGSRKHQEPYYDADLGHALSFYERLQEYCVQHDIDLFLMNNGDFVHGTGLSKTNPSDPSYLIPLLEKMPLKRLKMLSNRIGLQKHCLLRRMTLL
jgi:2',3'-cyclic-nucleotide 2'-phosphodiesterase (5'-nucleotidase family)